jgi:hypothetical protein
MGELIGILMYLEAITPVDAFGATTMPTWVVLVIDKHGDILPLSDPPSEDRTYSALRVYHSQGACEADIEQVNKIVPGHERCVPAVLGRRALEWTNGIK